MSEILRGVLGFKGEKGDSAYDIAVKNGFQGTEQDYLATLGASGKDELPIVTTINDSSTDTVAPSAKAVNTMKKELNKNVSDLGNVVGNLSLAIDNKMNFDNIAVITGSQSGIGAGATAIVDVNYPSGFNQANTVIIGKMISSNNNYYDTSDVTPTTNGFPTIKMIALTSSTIRIWLTNTNSTEARAGHFKITLLKTTAY
jgi:hypothetical protein